MNRLCRGWTLALLVLAAGGMARAARAGESIGAEAVIPLPPDAPYSRFIGPLPTHGETVPFNPPIFSWFYAPEFKLVDSGLYAFRFQVAEDAEFMRVEVDKVCTYNFYNTLKPFKARTLFWRVGYIPLPKTLGTVPDPDKVAEWSQVRRFTLAEGAVEWDRAMLADPQYLAARGHPRLIVTKENRAAIRAHIEADPAAKSMFEKLVQKAKQGMASPWWTGAEAQEGQSAAGSMASKSGKLCAAAFVMQVMGDKEIEGSRPQDALVTLAKEFVAEKLCHRDPTRDDISNPIMMLALSYDWLHHLLAPDQRKVVVEALDKTSDWTMNHFWWRQGVGRSWNYSRERDKGIEPATGEFQMSNSAGAKIGNSHGAEGFTKPFYGALAAFDEPDAPWSRELFEVGVNYLIAKTYFAGYRDGGFGEGAGYVMSVLPQAVDLTLILNAMFPEAGLTKNPYFANTSRFLRHYLPVGLPQSPWGDTTGISTYTRFGAVGHAMALLASDGVTLNQTAVVGNNSLSEIVMDLSVPALRQAPEARSDPETAACFPLSGWAMAHSLPPSSPNAVKDGVGIVFPCRPMGNYSHGGFFCNGSLSMYAYGRMLTFGESRYAFSHRGTSFAHNCVLVDGMGQAQNDHLGYYGDRTFFGRICAFKQAGDYAYFCGDVTRCYPGEKMSLRYYLGPSSHALLKARDLSYLKKARRHVLFMRKKYFLVYDELETDPAQPAQFTWVFHVVPQELAIEKTDTLRLRYEAGWPAKGESEGQRGPLVHIVHVADAGNLEILDTDHKDGYRNPISGEAYPGAQKPLEEAIEPAHHLWISNKVKKSTFHFLAVIYPVQLGAQEPRIARLDDATVEVSAGAERDVVAFVEAGAAVHPQATLTVDLARIEAEDARQLKEVLARQAKP